MTRHLDGLSAQAPGVSDLANRGAHWVPKCVHLIRNDGHVQLPSAGSRSGRGHVGEYPPSVSGEIRTRHARQHTVQQLIQAFLQGAQDPLPARMGGVRSDNLSIGGPGVSARGAYGRWALDILRLEGYRGVVGEYKLPLSARANT
jgi:hypothetical protein